MIKLRIIDNSEKYHEGIYNTRMAACVVSSHTNNIPTEYKILCSAESILCR